MIRTLDRGRLWAAQTPQVFRAETLRQRSSAGRGVTDDAALVEARGGRVRLVQASAGELQGHHLRSTLRVAEALLC